MQQRIQQTLKFTDQDLELNREGKVSNRQRLPYFAGFVLCCAFMIIAMSVLTLVLFSPSMFDWFGRYSKYGKLINAEWNRTGEIILWSVWSIVLVFLTRSQYRKLSGRMVKLCDKPKLQRNKWFARPGNRLGCAVSVKKHRFLVKPELFNVLNENQQYAFYYWPSANKLLSLEVIE